MQRYMLLMECTAGVRHAGKTVMLIKHPGNVTQVNKVCRNCGTQIIHYWDAQGRKVKAPKYHRTKAYRDFLDNHSPADARVAIMNSNVRKVVAPHGKDSPVLRLVPGGKAKVRRHSPRRVKRSKDKRRSA